MITRVRELAFWSLPLMLLTLAACFDAAAGEDDTASIGPEQAARILSAGDSAFRAGRVDEAMSTFRTVGNRFPTWWIPGAKYMVAARQAGLAPERLMAGLEVLVDLQPSGPYLPMLMTIAAGERLSPDDIRHLEQLSHAETDRPLPAVPMPSRVRNDDLDSRYRMARAMAFEDAGLVSAAETEYRSLLKLRPFAITPRVRLSMLLDAAGRRDEARALLTGAEGVSLLPSRIRMLSGQR